MGWALLILIVFICVFLLLSRVYTSKGKKQEEISGEANESAGDAAEVDGDE
ncbi:MAG TPA: hypothetical protein VMY06_07595 [Sedimentisphaerales bacterium]|nr:hypothetical protein [Sedimentisphaerales bacterium]